MIEYRVTLPRHHFMRRRVVALQTSFILMAAEGICYAQAPQPWCVPGTQVCAQSHARGSFRVGGSAQGQAGPNGASANTTGNATGNANANANANGQANAGGSFEGQGQSTYGYGYGYGYGGQRRYSRRTPFGVGSTFCATVKGGVYSGVKGGGCFAVSFRWEPIYFEMETQLLYGGTRHSIDWLFPMSFVVPLTSDDNLFEGLQLRVGGSPIGATFAEKEEGGTYIRFGLHAGVTYEWDLGDVSWRVFDARAFLDFGTKREVDDRGNFLDFGGQASTGIVL